MGDLQQENPISQLKNTDGNRKTCFGGKAKTTNGVDSEAVSVESVDVDEELLVGKG